MLGDQVGMSQAKISRLETGASSPDPRDVRVIAECLGLPATEVERLVGLAETADDKLIDWQSAEHRLPERQHMVRRLEASAREIRAFQPAVVVGLLQTSEYARALLSPVDIDPGGGSVASSALTVSEAVVGRLQRSQILYEPHRQFHFVMTESVLDNQVCSPADMLGQIARLREVARLPNVTVRLVPRKATLPAAPYHGFELIGDRVVLVDLFNTSLVSQGRSTVRDYRSLFDAFEATATAEIDPILDHHQRRYIGLLTSTAL